MELGAALLVIAVSSWQMITLLFAPQAILFRRRFLLSCWMTVATLAAGIATLIFGVMMLDHQEVLLAVVSFGIIGVICLTIGIGNLLFSPDLPTAIDRPRPRGQAALPSVRLEHRRRPSRSASASTSSADEEHASAAIEREINEYRSRLRGGGS